MGFALARPATARQHRDDVERHDPRASAPHELHVRERELPTGKVVRYAPLQIYGGYIQQLRSDHGLYRLWANDPDQAYERLDEIEADETVYACIDYLGLEAAGIQFSVHAEHKEHRQCAALVESGLKHIPDFIERRKSLLWAVTRGLALLHVTWQPVTCRLRPDTEYRTWMLPVNVWEVDKRRLRLQRIRRDVAFWTIYEPGSDAYVVIEDRRQNPRAAIAVQDFVWYWHRLTERSVGHGEGVGDAISESVYIKQRVRQYWADLSERFGKPFFEYVYDMSTGGLLGGPLDDTAFSSPEARADKMASVLQKWVDRYTLATPKGDELKIHEVGSASAASFEEFVRYLDGQIQLAILKSSTALTERQKGGLGSGNEKEISQDAVQAQVEYHQARMGEAFTRSLIEQFVQRNAHLLREMRMPLPERGDLSFDTVAQPRRKTDEVAKVFEVLGKLRVRDQMGADQPITVSEQWVRQTLDVPAPEEGEAVVSVAPDGQGAPDAGMGGFGGGGAGGMGGLAGLLNGLSSSAAPGGASNGGASAGAADEDLTTAPADPAAAFARTRGIMPPSRTATHPWSPPPGVGAGKSSAHPVTFGGGAASAFAYDESQHERDADGKFAPKGDGGGGSGSDDSDGWDPDPFADDDSDDDSADDADGASDSSSSGFDFDDWSDSGMTRKRAEAWHAAGVEDPDEAAGWAEEGFTPKQAGAWIAAEFDQDEAAEWTQYGVKPADAAAFRDAEFDAGDAADWFEAGVKDAAAAREFDDVGIDAYDAAEWIKAKVPADAAAQWSQSSNWNIDDAPKLHRAGVTPEVAEAYADAGITDVKDVAAWAPHVADPNDVEGWKDAEVKPADAAQWSAAGFVAEDSAEFRGAGLTADAAVRYSDAIDEWGAEAVGEIASAGVAPDALDELAATDFDGEVLYPDSWDGDGISDTETAALAEMGADESTRNAIRAAGISWDALHALHEAGYDLSQLVEGRQP